MDLRIMTDIGEVQLMLYVSPQGDVTVPLGNCDHNLGTAVFLRADIRSVQSGPLVNLNVDTTLYPHWAKHVGKVGIWCSDEGEVIEDQPILKIVEKELTLKDDTDEDDSDEQFYLED